MRAKFERITNPETCYICKGAKCKHCSNTGLFDKSGYILIAEDNNGKKIAFTVDQAGK